MAEFFSVTPMSWDQLGRTDMLIEGEARVGAEVSLAVNGQPLASTQASNGRFSFRIADTFEALEEGLLFSVTSGDDVISLENGAKAWRVTAPFISPGKAKLDVVSLGQEGLRLTKKGRFRPVFSPNQQEAMLSFFTEVEKVFQSLFDYQLLVTHGTLLGLWRDGQLIPGDDDIDCCYVSRFSDREQIVDERNRFFFHLARVFPGTELGTTGHIKIFDHHTGVEIDIMPAWVQGNTLHVSSYGSYRDGPDMVTASQGIRVGPLRLKTFSDPERFLGEQYGANWRTPDPGYRWPKKTSQEKRNLLTLRPRHPGQKGIDDFRDAFSRLTSALAGADCLWFCWGRTLEIVGSGGHALQAGGSEPGVDIEIAVDPRPEGSIAVIESLRRHGFQVFRVRGAPSDGLVVWLAFPGISPTSMTVAVTFLDSDSSGRSASIYRHRRRYTHYTTPGTPLPVTVDLVGMSLPVPENYLALLAAGSSPEAVAGSMAWDFWTWPEPQTLHHWGGTTMGSLRWAFHFGVVASHASGILRASFVFIRRAIGFSWRHIRIALPKGRRIER